MEDYKNSCRDINRLNPVVSALLKLALKEMNECGIVPLIVETYRSQERQYYLYGQGRTKEQLQKKGINPKYSHGGSIVTQTLNSIHTSKCAVDIVPLRNGSAIWNANDKETKKIIKIMASYGFECGANWEKFKDSPHFQIKLPYPDKSYFSQSNTNYFVTKQLQKRLGVSADGIWGKNTQKAVDNFRKKVGYKPTGTIGKDCVNKLFKR